VTRAFRFFGAGAAWSTFCGAGTCTGDAEAKTIGAGTATGLLGRWFDGTWFDGAWLDGAGSAVAEDARISAATAAIAVERPVIVTPQLWKRTP
jgi:hypothetical protein